MREGFIALLDDLPYVVRLFTPYAHASVLTLRLTRDRFAQPVDSVTPDDTLVVYRIRIFQQSLRDALLCAFASDSSTVASIIALCDVFVRRLHGHSGAENAPLLPPGSGHEGNLPYRPRDLLS